MTSEVPTRSRSVTAPMLHGVLSDIGLPLAAYYGLRALGADEWVSLLASTLVAGVRTVRTALRERRLNAFSALMLAVFGVGFVLTFVSGDPRVMILKNSAVTLTVGLLFLVTTVAGRPLTMAAAKAWAPGDAAAIDEAWAHDPAARRGYRVSALVWGLGMVSEAVLRVVLTYLLPVDVMVGLSDVLWIAVVGALVAWTRWCEGRDDPGARRPQHRAGVEAEAVAAGGDGGARPVA